MARPPSQEARAKLLRSTVELLLAGGIDAVSVEAVARHSGVAKTTLYRHFGGLDALVFAAATADVADVEGPDTGSLRGDLRAIQRHYLNVAGASTNYGVFRWMLVRSIQSPEIAALFRKERVRPRGPTVIALQRAIARGEIPPTTDIQLALHLIQGPLLSKRIIDDSELTDAEFEDLLEMTCRALGAGGSSSPPPPQAPARARRARSQRPNSKSAAAS